MFVMFKFLDVPSLEDAWVAALLDLQRKSKSVRYFDLAMARNYWKLPNHDIEETERMKNVLVSRLAEIKQSTTVTGERLEV